MTSRVKWRRVTNANCRCLPLPAPSGNFERNQYICDSDCVFSLPLSFVEHAHKSSVTLSWWFRVINRQLFRQPKERFVYIWGVRLIVVTTHTTHTHTPIHPYTHSVCVTCVLTLFPTVLARKMLRTFWPLIKLSHGSIISECVTVCVQGEAREVEVQSVAISLGCRDIYLTFDKQTKKSWRFVF